ncbi:MAG: type II secretion system protein M [Gammaproteobacteria bacterium]|nr:type II secretion system protein M [Gammaproteobacteria bacterium]
MDKRTLSYYQQVTPAMFRQRYRQLFATFKQLPSRRRRLLAGAVLLPAMLGFIFGLLLPAHRFADTTALEFREIHALFTWMQANASKVEGADRSAPVAATATADTILSTLADSAQSQGLSFKRFVPQENAELRVWLEDVSFDKLILWLDSLRRTHNIRVRQITVSRQNLPGLVNAVIVFAPV